MGVVPSLMGNVCVCMYVCSGQSEEAGEGHEHRETVHYITFLFSELCISELIFIVPYCLVPSQIPPYRSSSKTFSLHIHTLGNIYCKQTVAL